MNYLNYKRLTGITENTKHYRGTPDRYPLAYREHRHKCFIVKKDENGDNEYHIAYGYKYNRKEITKEEYEVLKAEYDTLKGNDKYWWSVGEWENRSDSGQTIMEYSKSWREWDIIGIVRKDNTFEFTSDRYVGQGTRYFLTEMWGNINGDYVNGFRSNINKGGVIYFESKVGSWQYGCWPQDLTPEKIIPIFKGQRIDLETRNSVLNYTVHAPKLNRARSKVAVQEYADQLKFAEMMFKTITPDNFKDEMREVYKEIYPTGTRWGWVNNKSDEIKAKARSNMATDILKAMYQMMIVYHIKYSNYIGAGNNWYSNEVNPNEYFKAVRQKALREIKVERGALDEVVYKANEVYPSNSWGIKIMVDGNEVKAY